MFVLLFLAVTLANPTNSDARHHHRHPSNHHRQVSGKHRLPMSVLTNLLSMALGPKFQNPALKDLEAVRGGALIQSTKFEREAANHLFKLLGNEDAPMASILQARLSEIMFTLNRLPPLQITGEAMDQYLELLAMTSTPATDSIEVAKFSAAMSKKLGLKDTEVAGMTDLFRPIAGRDNHISVCEYVRSVLIERNMFTENIKLVRQARKVYKIGDMQGVLSTEFPSEASKPESGSILFHFADISDLILSAPSDLEERNLDECEQSFLASMLARLIEPPWTVNDLQEIQVGKKSLLVENIDYKTFKRILKIIDYSKMAVVTLGKFNLMKLTEYNTLSSDYALFSGSKLYRAISQKSGSKFQEKILRYLKEIIKPSGDSQQLLEKQAEQIFKDLQWNSKLEMTEKEFLDRILSQPAMVHDLSQKHIQEIVANFEDGRTKVDLGKALFVLMEIAEEESLPLSTQEFIKSFSR